MKRGRRNVAVHYLRILARLEELVERDQLAAARTLLESVDPLEARALALELERDIEPAPTTGKLVGPARRLRARRERTPW